MTSPSTQQHTLVALNADVVGYSRLVSDDYQYATTAMAENRKLVDETVSRGGGRLVDFVGDNFMALFEDVRGAVQSAISIADRIDRGAADIPAHRRVRFRMGMDLGKVLVADNRYLGDALNVASRLQAMAPAGGLCISGRTYRALDEPALRFRPIGPQRLKHIPEEVDVYEFADLPSDADATVRQRSLSLESPTLAILPIHTKNADEQVAAAAEILRSDLIHRLTRVPQLKVVDMPAHIDRKQEAVAGRYMLESGVHQHKDQVRVYTTLIDITTMNIVKTYKRIVGSDALFGISDSVADDVARSIEIELIVGAPAGIYLEMEDTESITNIFQGWYHLRGDTKEGWLLARQLFEQVMEIHPERPTGYVLSAFTNWIGAANGWTPDPAATFSKAREQAQRGFDTGDPTGMAQAVEAAILMSEGKHDKALAMVEQLAIIRPTCDVTYGLEGSVRRYLGQWQNAVELIDVAMRMTGVNKPWYPTVKATALFIGGQLEQAASLAEIVLEFQPHNLEALLVLAAAQHALGMNRRSSATIGIINNRFPSVDVAQWLDRQPYQVKEPIEHWKQCLAAAGAIARR